MASDTQQYCMYIARLRGDFAVAQGRVVPSGLVKPCITSGILQVPVELFAQGLSVPISRGSPPISTS
jgi:hypothetical protein